MIALLIRPDVAIDRQMGLAAAVGLRTVNIALASVEALGTMRFRSMLERHDVTVAALHGHVHDADDIRLGDIARVLGAEPLSAKAAPWQRLELDASPDLRADLQMWTRATGADLTRLELAPTRAAWLVAIRA